MSAPLEPALPPHADPVIAAIVAQLEEKIEAQAQQLQSKDRELDYAQLKIQILEEHLRLHWIARYGSSMNIEKTHITHVNDGFVFLGHRVIRKRGPCGHMRPVTTIPREKYRGFSERLHGERFETTRQAKDAVLDWLLWNNRQRLHSTLNHLSPIEFECRWENRGSLAAA